MEVMYGVIWGGDFSRQRQARLGQAGGRSRQREYGEWRSG